MGANRITGADEIGQVIRRARQQRGMTQTELAQRLGVHRRYVSALENGHSTLALRRTLQALDVLGLQVAIDTERRPHRRKPATSSPPPAPEDGPVGAARGTRSPLAWLRRRRR